MANHQNRAVTKVLVHWKGQFPDNATWEFYQDFVANYPDFTLEDKYVFKGEYCGSIISLFS